MEIRKVKIEEYWPLIVRGTEEFGQIAVAENPEFNRLAESVYGCLKESFILPGEEEHATEYGVSRWEKMLGLAVTPDMTLDDRKAAILTYMSIKLPYTWRVLKQMLTELLGEDNFEITLNNDTQELAITYRTLVSETHTEAVEQLVSRVVPVNLLVKYDYDVEASMKILEKRLTDMLGEGNVIVDPIDDDNIVIHTDRVSEETLVAVDDLLKRVLPQNIDVVKYNHNIEVSWRDINKYAHCTNVDDMLAVNPDYQNDLTEDGEWIYPLPVFNARRLFANAKNLKKLDIELPALTDMTYLTSWSGVKEVKLVVNNVTHFSLGLSDYLEVAEFVAEKATRFDFTVCRKLRIARFDSSKITTAINGFERVSSLEECPMQYPALSTASNMFPLTQFNLEQTSELLGSLPTWTDGELHEITVGIHVDYQNDAEMLAVIENTESRGWTLTIRWNGTPTSGVSTTDLEEIYAKVTESEHGEYTDENGNRCMLEWGHYVTDTTEHKLFYSLVEAEQYFKLTRIENHD